MNRRSVAAFGLAVSAPLALASVADADEESAKVLVVGDGPGSDAVVEAVAKTKVARISATAKKAKDVPCKLADVTAKGPARTKVVDCLRERVDADKASAVVVVHVVPGKARVAEVRIVSSDPYVETFEAKVPLGAKPGPDDATAVLAVVEPKLGELAPKAKPAPTAAPAASSTDTPAPTASTSAPGPLAPRPLAPQVSVELGAFVGARSFGYADATGTTLRDYSLLGALGLVGGAEAFPGASFPSRTFQLGLAFRAQTSTGLGSETASGRRIATTWTRLDAQLRGRILLGDGGSSLTLGFGYSREAFLFAERSTSLPSARYESLRGAVDLRLVLGPVAVLIGGAVLPGLARPIGVADRWAGAKSFGFEASLGAALALGSSVDLRVRLAHTRIRSTYEAPPADAAGATDALSRLEVTLGFSY